MKVKGIRLHLKLKRQFVRFFPRKIDKFAFILFSFLVFIGIAAPYISPYRPNEMSTMFIPPSLEHLLGTDALGRDVLSRIIYGSRLAFLFAGGCAGLSLVIGTLLGAIPGYYGGWVDQVFSRFFDIFLSIPPLFLLIVALSIFGTNILLTMIIVSLTIWPSNAKIARGMILSHRKRTYVQAATVSGASDFRILFVHILPNALPPVIANSTLQMVYAVIAEASLSFLGLGDINQISWGQLIYKGRTHVFSAPWIVISAGLALTLFAIALNMIGDRLSIMANPELMEETS